MNEADAKAALREMGIAPTKALIKAWIRAAQAEQALEVYSAMPRQREDSIAVSDTQFRAISQHPRGYSKSRLEPILREQGSLEVLPGKSKPGRPRIVASWFPAVAHTMADGTSLRTALAVNHIKLSQSEIRACYRNTTLRALYTESRRKYFLEHGYGKKPSLRALVGSYV